MTQPTSITLVRHGETIWNRERRLQGSQDIPLSELGIRQAHAVAKRLQNEQHHRVYSSDLRRAHHTAETIAHALQIPHHVHEQLRERSYGEIEGMTRDELLVRYPDFWAAERPEYDVPGLETITDLRQRALYTLREIADRHPGEQLLVVSHGGTISAFLHAISNGAYGSGQTRLENTSLSRVIRTADGAWQIETVNDIEHLPQTEQEAQ